MGSNWIAPTETPGNEQGDEVYVDSPDLGKYLGGDSPEGSQAATQAMLQMKKLDLNELKRAYEAATN